MDFTSRPDTIKNYTLLQNLGVFDEINSLSFKIKELEELLIEATEIFTQHNIEDLIKYIITCLSSKFIPADLVFLLKDSSSNLEVFSYRNTKQVDNYIKIEGLDYFEEFFSKYPNTIHFEMFKLQFDQDDIIEQLEQADPQMIVPVIGIEGLYGIIVFGKKILDNQYSDIEIAYIDRLMKFTIIALQNNIHYRNAVTDQKTGLHNHHYFAKRLSEEISISRRYKNNIGILVMDIDHFKIFNDSYGHLAGDAVLVEIANVLKRTTRQSDVVARFGGEEFTVLLHRSNKILTWRIAERIRKEVENLVVEYMDKSLHVTISIGCAVYNGSYAATEKDLITQADAALYASKDKGRNKVSMNRGGLLFSAEICREIWESLRMVS